MSETRWMPYGLHGINVQFDYKVEERGGQFSNEYSLVTYRCRKCSWTIESAPSTMKDQRRVDNKIAFHFAHCKGTGS